MAKKNFTEKDLKRILTNPFYCLNVVDESFVVEHETMISEKEFIKASENLIKEIGVEEYLKNLLENLKGNFVKSEE